jgi:hypothetical protein
LVPNTRSAAASGAAILVGIALSIAAPAQVVRLGSEFRVNSHVLGFQYRPAVAADADGDFVVVWSGDGLYSSNFDVFGQRYSSSGAAVDLEFLVNSYLDGWRSFASVAMDTDGDFVVAWTSSQSGRFDDIFAQRFSSAGYPLAGEFQVNTYTDLYQFLPSVAADADGDFSVVWTSSTQDGDDYGVFGRRFTSAGEPLAVEFQVNTYTRYTQLIGRVAADAEGDFVVVWKGPNPELTAFAVLGRRFSSAGTPLADEFQVNVNTVDYLVDFGLDVEADGDFVVTWSAFTEDASRYGVLAARFSSAGTRLANEFQVNQYTVRRFSAPVVAIDGAGGFVVAWNAPPLGSSTFDVFARRFASEGTTTGGQFQVNTYTRDDQFVPVAAIDGDGDFVIAWQSFRQDRYQWGVFAQRFASGAQTPTATSTATSTPTLTPTPSSSSTPSIDAPRIYPIPTLSRRSMALLVLFLLTACLVALLRRAG